MANTAICVLDIPQVALRVCVDYYNPEEREKLHGYPTSGAIQRVVEEGIEIPTQEFLTYYLFHKKRPGKYGWRDYEEIGRQAHRAIAELADWVTFGRSISIPPDVGHQDRAITERIGESIGLSVVNRIHEFADADWDKIPEHPGRKGFRTFDYSLASDGTRVVQVETKGTCVSDNNLKTANVSNHKADIANKKQKIAQAEARGDYQYISDLRYGTITVIGENPNDPVRCLLLDPPTDNSTFSPLSIRLLLRLSFFRDYFSVISPRSPFLTALQNRLADLRRVPDAFSLNGLPLVRSDGEPFFFFRNSGPHQHHSSFFGSKSKILGSPDGGIVVPLLNGNLFFLGVRADTLDLVAAQNFDKILTYKAEYGALSKFVECVVPTRDYRRWGLSESITQLRSQTNGSVTFRLRGIVHYSNSGLIYGVLPVPDSASH